MFGPRMYVPHEDGWIMLRPFEKAEMPIVASGFQGLDVHMYTHLSGASTLEDEEEWFDRTRNEKRSHVWAIVPLSLGTPIGITSINSVERWSGSCRTGIIIWNKDWWGRRVASTTHIARTLFAADFLNMATITSGVAVPNAASMKALLRVGYVITGRELRTGYRSGRYYDYHLLSWIHPERIDLLYPEGLPQPLSDEMRIGLENAKTALLTGREIVRFDQPDLEEAN